MKKIIFIIICFSILLWIPLFFYNCYRQFHYLDEDHFSVVLKTDLELAQTGKLSEEYLDYYKRFLNTDIAPLLQKICPVLLKTKFVPMEKREAFHTAIFNNIDKNSRVIFLPADYEKEFDISFLQFFQLDEKRYMYCFCGNGDRFLFYSYDDNEELSALLQNDCFSEENRETLMEKFQKEWYQNGTFSTVFYKYWGTCAFYLLKVYLLPVLLSNMTFFFPFLIKRRNNTIITKKFFVYKTAKVGLIIVPGIIGICCLLVIL